MAYKMKFSEFTEIVKSSALPILKQASYLQQAKGKKEDELIVLAKQVQNESRKEAKEIAKIIRAKTNLKAVMDKKLEELKKTVERNIFSKPTKGHIQQFVDLMKDHPELSVHFLIALGPDGILEFEDHLQSQKEILIRDFGENVFKSMLINISSFRSQYFQVQLEYESLSEEEQLEEEIEFLEKQNTTLRKIIKKNS